MKKNLVYIMLAIFSIGFVACSDENDGPFLKSGDDETGKASISLIAPEAGGSYILREENADDTWEIFSWEDANDVMIGPMEYYVDVAVSGTEDKLVTVGPYTTQPISITEGELNNALVELGYTEANTQVDVLTNVRQTVGSALEYYSEQVASSVIIYGGSVDATIPVLYVPGSYQGNDINWSPDNTYELYSNSDDGVYQGYMNFISGSEEFKFSPEPSWGSDFGGTSIGTSGTIGGSDNIKFTGDIGSYLMTVDENESTWILEATTWEATANSWGIIGDATPGGWDTDTDMEFQQWNGLLVATLALTDGEIKFRANDGWDLDYGDTGADGVADRGGDNIKVTAGTYIITLDMRNPAQVTYTLEAK